MPDTSPSPTPAGKLRSVPVEIRVSVGHARPSIAELLELRREDILPLDRRLEDPVELYIGDRLVALGELVEAEEGGLGVRVTELVDASHG